ncbi:MAG TPA: ATP-binding protein [Stellaceae bacterium]|nr:ATP-binding protein [Stellaceae bacterium]
MHKLLQRQLKQSRRDTAGTETDLETLLGLIDAAYCEVDRERRIMSHAYQVMRDEQAALAARQMNAQELVTSMRTAKADAERARAVAEAELLKKERLSVLGQLTATVAHELRNPLSAIRNSLHAIRELTRASEVRMERPMARIERSIARCDSIISDLLDYARPRELDRTGMTLDPWLAEVLDEQKLPNEVTLERRLGAGDAVVTLDPDRFRRVIINLIENAAQALFETEAAGGQRRITVSTASTDMTEISIEDNGPGIPPDVLPRIFEPLFSTKSFGTGLGLPTVKQIVEQHDGTVAIASDPGCGACVRIRLPRAAALPRRARA